MKKFIIKLDLHDDKDKRKAMKIVSSLAGIDSISVDMKGKKMTVTGTVDPVTAVSKLRKFWQADIISVGPAKEPEKKEEPKKEEAKKEEPKKEEPKKEEGKKEEAKKEEPKKEEPKKEEEAKKEEPKKEEEKKEAEKKKEPEPPPQMVGFVPPYRPYFPPMNGVVPYNGVMPYTYRPYYPPPPTYYVQNVDEVHENPNSCVIC